MTLDMAVLRHLDAQGYRVVDAVTRSVAPKVASHATPHGFVCRDGKTYWVKAQAQRGLASELIAGRLAFRVGAGPIARVVRVPPEALPTDGSAPHLLGVNVGMLDAPNTENARNLGSMLQAKKFDPAIIDGASRALVVAFQAWVCAGDAQVLVNFKTGHVLSIDHGDCFGALGSGATPGPAAVNIPGVDPDVGREAQYAERAAAAIQAVSDTDLIEAVAQIPDGQPWSKDESERFAIAEHLAQRRDRMTEVMEPWLK